MILIAEFPSRRSSYGGVELQALNFSQDLSRKGVEVHVITKSEWVFPAYERIDDVMVHRMLYSPRSVLLRFVPYVCALIYVLKLNPNIINVIGVFPDGFFASIASSVLRRPLIVMSSDSDVRLANARVINLFWRMIFRTARILIVHERESANLIARYADKKKVVVLPSGVDVSRFQLNRRKCRDSIGLKRNEKMVLYVGRTDPVKNLESLLAAFTKIREQFQDVRLFLVGAGPSIRERSEMSRLKGIAVQFHIDQCTEFVGEVSPRDVPKYMVAADVFALPSISEGSPVVILEALAAGLPVLASSVGGVPYIVRDGREGLLFKAGSVAQMANLMGVMLRDSQLRRKMSREAEKRARSFSMNERNGKIFELCVSTLIEPSGVSTAR